MPATTLIAVPLTSADPPLAAQVDAARAAGAELVELRADCIGDVAAIETLLAGPRSLPFVLTVRAPGEGGHWVGHEAERIALIERLGLLHPGYVDVEYATWQRSANIRQKIGLVCGEESDSAAPGARAKNRLILSHHDFTATPRDLAGLFDKLAATPAEVIKLVFTPHDATDACRVLSQMQRYARTRPVIALALGEAGLLTRVLARKFGAWLTFATLESGTESAPGQPTIRELRELYRWDRIAAQTPAYGVVGWPVAHSQSPLVHNAALSATELDGVYLPLPVGPDYADFARFMDYLQENPELDFRGLSVTLPHKVHALRWLDEHGGRCTPLARRCGAVNTLTRDAAGPWWGDNTDAPGALAALRCVLPGALIPQGFPVDVLGAGGVARAIAAALLDAGCTVTIYNRSAARGADLARELRCAAKSWAQRTHATGRVLVNCTSLGLWPAVDESPMPDDAVRPGTVVFDTVYRPAETRLLRMARARGCPVVAGVELFIRQAASQYECWHGRPAPLRAMSSALPHM